MRISDWSSDVCSSDLADDWSTQCPGFADHITLAFAKPVDGTFGRIAVYIPADIAGAHAEGSYTFALFIPKELIPLIAPEWRASFAGGCSLPRGRGTRGAPPCGLDRKSTRLNSSH